MELKGCCSEFHFTPTRKVMAALEQLRDTPIETTDTDEDAALIINGTENIESVALLFI
jgi:hypothetical protein